MTSQRRIILEALEGLDTHPSAEELFAISIQQDNSINLSTVYRTLHWLEQVGLVRARLFASPDPAARGSRFDKALPVEHYHFICTACNRVIEFDTTLAEAIKTEFQQASQAEVESASILLYGLCPCCKTSQPEQ